MFGRELTFFNMTQLLFIAARDIMNYREAVMVSGWEDIEGN